MRSRSWICSFFCFWYVTRGEKGLSLFSSYSLRVSLDFAVFYPRMASLRYFGKSWLHLSSLWWWLSTFYFSLLISTLNLSHTWFSFPFMGPTLLSEPVFLMLMLIKMVSNSSMPQNHLCSLLKHTPGNELTSTSVVLIIVFSSQLILFLFIPVTNMLSLTESQESRQGSFWRKLIGQLSELITPCTENHSRCALKRHARLGLMDS